MIYVKNQGDQIFTLHVSGTLTTTSAVIDGPAAFTGQIRAVYAKLLTAGTGGTMTVDLLKNGASLCSSGTLFTFGTTTAATYNTANLSANPPTVTKGDIFGLSVPTVNTTTPASGIVVAVVISRGRGGVPVGALQTDTYEAY